MAEFTGIALQTVAAGLCGYHAFDNECGQFSADHSFKMHYLKYEDRQGRCHSELSDEAV